ncbi:hypothetical protein ACHAWF_008191 [Thalassiosira exigua]
MFGTLASSENHLFRRHRNRNRDAAADENDDEPAPSSNTGVDGGGDVESPSRPLDPSRSSDDDATGDIAAPSDDITTQRPQSPPPLTDSDEERELVVQVSPRSSPSRSLTAAGSPFLLPSVAWEPSPEATTLRRAAILREVERIQRANFVHFLVLCLVPTTLLLVVISAIVSEDGACEGAEGGLTVCEREKRSFVNAFTSRCICRAVRVVAGAEAEFDEGSDEEV